MSSHFVCEDHIAVDSNCSDTAYLCYGRPM